MIESSPDSPLELALPLLSERNYGDTQIRIYGQRAAGSAGGPG
jgi:hypothetical protein